MYAAIEDLVPDRAFTIFTGDVVEGAIWSVTGTYLTCSVSFITDTSEDTEVGNDLNDAYALMAGLGQYYALVGNHDSCPVNSFPPSEVSTTITSQWVYNNISADWSEWIGSDAATEVANNYGCYSVVDSTTGLRVIAYNSNFWYTDSASPCPFLPSFSELYEFFLVVWVSPDHLHFSFSLGFPLVIWISRNQLGFSYPLGFISIQLVSLLVTSH